VENDDPTKKARSPGWIFSRKKGGKKRGGRVWEKLRLELQSVEENWGVL